MRRNWNLSPVILRWNRCGVEIMPNGNRTLVVLYLSFYSWFCSIILMECKQVSYRLLKGMVTFEQFLPSCRVERVNITYWSYTIFKFKSVMAKSIIFTQYLPLMEGAIFNHDLIGPCDVTSANIHAFDSAVLIRLVDFLYSIKHVHCNWSKLVLCGIELVDSLWCRKAKSVHWASSLSKWQPSWLAYLYNFSHYAFSIWLFICRYVYCKQFCTRYEEIVWNWPFPLTGKYLRALVKLFTTLHKIFSWSLSLWF